MPLSAACSGLSVLLAAGVSLAHAAPAFPEAEVWAGLLAELDRNADGRVTPEEYAEKGDVRHFADLDRDHDGSIDVTELADWVRLTPPRPERSSLIGPTDAPADAAPAAPPEGGAPPPPTAPPAAGSPPSAPVSPPASTAAAARPPSSVASPSAAPEPDGPLRWAAAIVGVIGALSLGGGLWVRSRRSRTRGRRRRR